MLENTIQKIRELVDINSVIGEQIVTADGTTIIPISKVSVGFAGGGSDFVSKNVNKYENPFGGGVGGGVNVTPIAFLVVSGGKVDMLQLVAKPDTSDRLVNMIPDVVDKLTELIGGKKKAELEDAGL
jgi:sporulation protein YtfJ